MEQMDSTSSQGMATSDWDTVYSNFDQICRICGLQSEFLMPIFDGEGLQHCLDHKIQTYLYLQVLREDILPLQLCYDCVSTLLSWHTLFLKCQDTVHKFQVMLGSKSQVQFTESQEPVFISSFATPQHGFAHPPVPVDFIEGSHNDPSLVINDSVSHHAAMAPAPHIKSNPSWYIEGIQPPQLHPSGIIHKVSSPYEEESRDCPESIILSPPLAREEFVGMCHTAVTTDINSSACSERRDSFLYVSKQRVNETIDQNTGESSSCTDRISATDMNFSKESSVYRSKEDFSQSHIRPAESPLRGMEQEKTSLVSNQVSAIRSTNCRSVEPVCSLSTNRSRSVLVRNESVHPFRTSGEGTAEMEMIIESAVIRKHYHTDPIVESGSGSMVSVVRPTCLRRAPTAEIVIEKKGEEHHPQEEIEASEQMPKVVRDSKEESLSVTGNPTDNQDVDPGSSGIPSPTSWHEEDTRASDISQRCYHCGKFISNTMLLLSHERSHLVDENPPTSFTCKFCAIPQRSLSELHSHYHIHDVAWDKVRRNHSKRKAQICKQCGLTFTTEERLAAHMRLHTDVVESYGHNCKTCGATFNTRSKLSVHLWTHALKPSLKTFKCHICGKGFGTKPAVMEHRLKHTDEEKSRAFKCVVCGLAFGNNTLLGKHRSTHSKEELSRPFKCSFCGKAFARNHTLHIHYFTHSKEKSHPCSQCGKRFKMRNSLIQHLRTHQDPSVFPTHACHLCSKTFRVKSRLRDHLRMHSGDKPFECAACGKCFHKIGALHTHEVSHTERRPFVCDVCGKAFKWNKNLHQHRSIHSEAQQKPQPLCTPGILPTSGKMREAKPQRQYFQCEICSKQLSGRYCLRMHMNKMHNGRKAKEVKTTVCPVCEKVLSTSGALARHMKTTHGGIKAFKCDVCNREYSTKVARDDHRRSHTGERPYSCNMCSKTFTSLSNLHIHRSSHSEDRPYKCTYCDKQFKRRAHLVPHIRTHTGEKPYVCDVCSRGFAQSNDLHKHRLTHVEAKAHACHCGLTFRNKRDLTHHQDKRCVPNHSIIQGPPGLSGQLPSNIDIGETQQQLKTHVPISGDQRSSSIFAQSFDSSVEAYHSCITTTTEIRNSRTPSLVNNSYR